MVEFETLKAEEIKFGNNNFIEVARKKAKAEDGSENEFVAISRGFFAPDGSKRFKKSFTVPDQPDVVDFICANIKEMASSEGYTQEQAPAEAAPAEEEAAPAEEAPAEEEATEETEEKAE